MAGLISLVQNALETYNLLSLRGFLILVVTLCGFNLACTVATAVYNLYLHPLRKVPGPWPWIAFPFLKGWVLSRGFHENKILEYHEKYGDVVRVAADELSFTTADAWKDIYGHGHAELPKWYPPGIPKDSRSIISSNARDHFRFRRAMLPAFSDKALGQQEPLIAVYVDLLVQKLREGPATDGQATNMVHWFSLTTFDLIADLAYGKPLQGLAEGKSNAWIESIEKMIRFMPYLILTMQMPLLGSILKLLAGPKMRDAKKEHMARIEAMCRDRISGKGGGGDRGDFMDYMMRSRGQEHQMHDDELVVNSDLIMVAGSETTATLLSGAVYWMLKTPRTLSRATEEVRRAFDSDGEINFRDVTARLPYLMACLTEALRVFPPVPLALVRQVPENGPPLDIAGISNVPPKTRVGVHHLSTYLSPRNFHLPREFHPERWLPQAINDPSSPFYADRRDVHRPFSYGPRDCIGRNLANHEMRLIMAKLLWNFDLALDEERCGDWHVQKAFGLWEKPFLGVYVRERKETVDGES